VSTRAIAELRRAGVAHEVREYDVGIAAPDRGGGHGYGLDAARALGVDPRRIFKTLVASVDGRLAVAIVPVAGELDLKSLADALGGRRAEMADPADAERATGYVVGGISPVGQRRRLPTVLDESARTQETILVSAGRRGLQVELAPGDLARVTAATFGPIVRID
jgi:Cys-tRNA(Pro)/Cys-tRNA(Cys) deacylase